MKDGDMTTAALVSTARRAAPRADPSAQMRHGPLGGSGRTPACRRSSAGPRFGEGGVLILSAKERETANVGAGLWKGTGSLMDNHSPAGGGPAKRVMSGVGDNWSSRRSWS